MCTYIFFNLTIVFEAGTEYSHTEASSHIYSSGQKQLQLSKCILVQISEEEEQSELIQ
jgi:hypothetical protein